MKLVFESKQSNDLSEVEKTGSKRRNTKAGESQQKVIFFERQKLYTIEGSVDNQIDEMTLPFTMI